MDQSLRFVVLEGRFTVAPYIGPLTRAVVRADLEVSKTRAGSSGAVARLPYSRDAQRA